MAKVGISTKHVQIDKANAMVVGMVSFAAFIVTFSLFASKAMLAQRSYQSKVIAQKSLALKQLKANIQAVTPLTEAYQKFVGEQTNVIGGVPNGIGNQDGDNAKIILDALPSKYDFPAVTSSLDKLLASKDFRLTTIKGTDDEINQLTTKDNALIPIPFEVTLEGSYPGTKEAISLFERSIRPFQIDTLTLTAGDKNMTLDVLGKTYYQPEKSLKIQTKDVR